MSEMHITWVKYLCGRLESRLRYSNRLVYNNYPWPENPTKQQQTLVGEKAQAVLHTRALYPDSSLAELYDPLTMPVELVKAHRELDSIVDSCYRNVSFKTEMERLKFLFDLYEKYTKASD